MCGVCETFLMSLGRAEHSDTRQAHAQAQARSQPVQKACDRLTTRPRLHLQPPAGVQDQAPGQSQSPREESGPHAK